MDKIEEERLKRTVEKDYAADDEVMLAMRWQSNSDFR